MCTLKSKEIRFCATLKVANAQKLAYRSTTTFNSSYSKDAIVFIPVLVVLIPMLIVSIPNRLLVFIPAPYSSCSWSPWEDHGRLSKILSLIRKIYLLH